MISASEDAGAPAYRFLTARGLHKSYGRATAPAVDGVDFDIGERAFTTLLGPSGCGKTTILRMIAGFEQPSAGELRLEGVSLAGVPPEKRPVNTVFQSYALFPHLSVAENVAFALRLRSGEGNIDRKVRHALDAVNMADFMARFPHELSGGQQQRVAVARAMIAEPRLLLLDEPLSALDRKMRVHLQSELKELQRRLRIAFVYVTHDQEEAFALSDTIIVMNKGRIIQIGPPEEIYARPVTTFVADFIGGATMVDATVIESRAGSLVVETSLGTYATPGLPSLQVGAQAALILRPEALQVFSTAEPGAHAGTVVSAVFQGRSFMVAAEVAGMILRYTAESAPENGSATWLQMRPARTFATARDG